MAQFTWSGGMPSTGALKTSYLASKLYLAAIAETVAAEHASTETGFGKGKGESVTLPRIGNITESADYSLSETERIPEKIHTVTGKVVTVVEFGGAVPITSFAKDLSQFDLQNSVQAKLKEDMKLALDSRALKAFKDAKVKYIPTGLTAATITTNGTPSTAALANMNVYHAEEIRDYLYDTLKAPTADGSNYVGIFRSLGMRGLKRDPDWELWHQYTDPEAKYNSEVGRLEQIRFIETNHGPSAAASTTTSFGLAIFGTSDVLGEGVVFGADAVAFVEVMTPELRIGVPQDFGRSQAVAWYGIYEFSIIYDTANAGEARIVHVCSNA